jgi:cytochrome c-type biogenesis protein CcmH
MREAGGRLMCSAARALGAAMLATLLIVVSARADGLDDETLNIARELQCPICQGLSVADSPSQLAVQMRGVIREKLVAGESRDAIMSYFAERYGDSVLMSPPNRGFTAFAWIAPYVAVAIAVGVVVWVASRRPAPAAHVEPRPRLDGYLDEVDRAFGELRDQPLR